MNQTYSINSKIYYNQIHHCYEKIIVIDRKPIGPLKNIVKPLKTPKLSPFQTSSSPCYRNNVCSLAIYNPNNTHELLTPNSLPILISYLRSNKYIINFQLTNTLTEQTNNLIFYISYISNKIDF